MKARSRRERGPRAEGDLFFAYVAKQKWVFCHMHLISCYRQGCDGLSLLSLDLARKAADWNIPACMMGRGGAFIKLGLENKNITRISNRGFAS